MVQWFREGRRKEAGSGAKPAQADLGEVVAKLESPCAWTKIVAAVSFINYSAVPSEGDPDDAVVAIPIPLSPRRRPAVSSRVLGRRFRRRLGPEDGDNLRLRHAHRYPAEGVE